MIYIRDYDDARTWELLRRSERLFDTPNVRAALHKFYRSGSRDRLAESLRERPRCHCFDSMDGYTEYAVWDGNMNDLEVEERIMDELYIPFRNSPYDCTGQLFTASYRWKRCSGGISVIHVVAMDV